jgi:hypothetical protein
VFYIDRSHRKLFSGRGLIPLRRYWLRGSVHPRPAATPLVLLPRAARSRLQALTLYGSDIFVLANGETISLWANDSGYSPAGLDYLIGKRTEYYARRQRDRTLMKGDRVAVLGRGIAVVKQADDTEVHAMLRNRIMLRMRRKDIVWNRQNIRWETSPLACVEANGKA